VHVNRGSLAAWGAVALFVVGRRADADATKAECVKANADAQTLRIAGKLGASRDKLTLCADPSCPVMVRDDCTQRLDELEHAQPTVVFEVKDASGSDVGAVRVTIDGQPLADKLAGTALKVEPGEHAFTFTADGQDPLTRSFVIHEGEKERRELIQLHAQSPAAASPDQSVAGGGIGGQRVLGLTAGGLGVAGVVVGSIFGITSTSAASRQGTDCASPTICTNHTQAVSDHSTATTDGTISTVAFVAGGALLAAGVTLFLTGGRSSEKTSGGLVVTPSVGPGTAALSLQWRL
jgi:hypothetical protein